MAKFVGHSPPHARENPPPVIPETPGMIAPDRPADLEAETERKNVLANEFRNVKLQTFWQNRPKLWFATLECEFTAFRVRSDDIKYSAVVRHLDEQSMIVVADVLEQPPEQGKYERLKSALIERFSDSTEKQLRTLLDGMELGNKSPSALLREMRTLAGSNVTDNMLRTLWLQRMPKRTQELLAILDDVDLDKLAACADKAHERGASQNIIAAASSALEDPIQVLTRQVSELTKAVAAIYQDRQTRPRSRRPRSTTPKRSRSREQEGFCFYHRRFRERAWKCQKPCTATFPLASQVNSDDRQ
ncbi:hypothetical protein KM043_015789 [Ampulex compressa]|nr:hypothetical protein KM043_015789 [Ampulex compressa]